MNLGQAFGRRVVRGRTPERLGYQVQLIESDLVPYGTWQDNRAVLGIERDEYGAPVRYRVWPYRPSLWRSGYGMQQIEAQDVPALDVRHLRRASRRRANAAPSRLSSARSSRALTRSRSVSPN